ncbi:MAG: tocopherol cyclase family protein [Elusimicrobia bacterium]|nr:tocopherol cyclase family protein [Elusimicrobiota bacterium]
MKNFVFALLILVLPAALQAQESEALKKLQNIPWQKNEFIDDNLGVFSDEKGLIFGEKSGPRFEGWYTRITDQDGQRSFAFIVGSFLPDGVSFSPSQSMTGYIAVLISDISGKTLRVYETFPEKTNLSVNGKKVFNENPLEHCSEGSDCRRSDFEWTAQGYGRVDNKGFSLEIPGEINIKGDFGEPIYWNGERNASPEGMATYISLMPIHWYVHSLGSLTKYEYNITAENISVKSLGYAHIEKNWGRSFPRKWIWSQGITGDNSSHYALAGGEIDLGVFKMTAFLAGLHTPKISWDFKPQQGTVFKAIINSCAGTFSIALARPGKTLFIESVANLNTFGKVSIPTSSGFVTGGGAESFSAKTTIEAYKINMAGTSTLVEKKIFNNSALEFGANYMCGGFGRE